MMIVMMVKDYSEIDFNETDSGDIDFNMMDSIRVSKAVEALRVRAFLRGVALCDIARQVKQTPVTVGRKLKRLDMSLSDFCAFARAIGENPIRLLSDVFEREI